MIAAINNGPSSRWPGALTRKYRRTLEARPDVSARRHGLNLIALSARRRAHRMVTADDNARTQERLVRALSNRYWRVGASGPGEFKVEDDVHGAGRRHS